MTEESNATPTQYPAEEGATAPETPPAEEGTTEAEPIPEAEEGTFESPTSNDVGEQTLTQADTAEGTEEA